MTFPFPQMPPSTAPVTYTYNTFDFSNANTTAFTFTSKSIGTAAANRKVVIVVGGNADLRTVSTLTVGGISASLVKRQQNADGTSEIWQADVPTGTTANVVVTWSGPQNTCGIGSYSLYGAAAAASATASNTSNPLSTTINIPAGGVCIGTVQQYGGSQTWSWSGLTEDFDSTMGGSRPFSGASTASSGGVTGQTVTATPSGSPSGQTLALASWAPA
jgi:hypothetical protein